MRSRGLGDTIYKTAKMIGADKVAKAYEKVTGKPCGCQERRDTLNSATLEPLYGPTALRTYKKVKMQFCSTSG